MAYRFADKIIKDFVYTHSSKTDVASTFRAARKKLAEEEAKKRAADQVVKPMRRKA